MSIIIPQDKGSSGSPFLGALAAIGAAAGAVLTGGAAAGAIPAAYAAGAGTAGAVAAGAGTAAGVTNQFLKDDPNRVTGLDDTIGRRMKGGN